MAHTHEHKETGNIVKKVTIILTVLTLIELGLGFLMMKMPETSAARTATKALILLLMLSKAYYIVAFFMHLKYEAKSFITTIVVPLGLFIWFVIAFLYDGHSWKNLRNTYDPYYKKISTEKVEPKPSSHSSETH